MKSVLILLSIVAFVLSLVGLKESVSWTAVESDRPLHFSLGLIFFLFGLLFWKLADLV